MTVQVGELSAEVTPAVVGRAWYYALGASTLAHVSVILALTGIVVATSDSSQSLVDTRWTSPDPSKTVTEIVTVQSTTATPTSQVSGGSQAAASMIASPNRVQVDSPFATESVFDAPFDDVLMSGALADDVGILLTIGTGDSTGEGNGTGDGKGDGFFGMAAQGKSFVYVVDCSLSMNHPHDSPAKTRFKRLKLELVKSIGRMQPSQQFFIIFFNQQVVPMPARSMQYASSETKQHFLKWVTKVRADGDTDPRAAISMAMKFNPDVIYFLTDGSFEFRTKKALNKMAQKRVAIHTFALGNREGEPILKGLADRNRGKYHYIP